MTIHQRASFDVEAAGLNATSKTNPALAKMVAAWENKNAKRAMQGSGLALMAMSLTACGGSSTVTPAATTTTTTTTTTTVAAQTLTLTTRGDDLTGGAGADTFNALTAGQIQSADTLDGAGGIDTLDMTIANSVAQPTLTSIEKLIVQSTNDGADLDLDLSDTSVTDITVISSATDLDILNIQNNVTLTIQDVTSGATGLTMDFDTDALGSATATATIKTDGSTVALDYVTTGTSDAITVVDITTSGTASAITVGLTNVLTLNVAGTANLSVINVNASTQLTSVAASTMTGGLTFDLDDNPLAYTINTGSGVDAITADQANTGTGGRTINLGSGNDTLNLGAEGSQNDDTLNGGLGTDTLVLGDASDITAALTAGVSGFETLQVSELASHDMAGFSSDTFTRVVADTANNTGTLAFANVRDAVTTLQLINSTATDGAVDAGDDVSLGRLVDGAANSLTISVGSATVTAVEVGDELIADNEETITIDANAGSLLLNTGLSADDMTSLVVIGDNAVDLSVLSSTLLRTVDLSGLEDGNFTASFANATNTVTVTANVTAGNTGVYNIIGGGSDDTMTGTVGIDTFDGGGANDTFTLGGGVDSVVIDGSGLDIITDFVVGAAGDQVDLDETALGSVIGGDGADDTDGQDTVVEFVTGTETLAAGDNILVLSGTTFATAALAGAALEAGGGREITFTNATTAGDDIIFVYSDGTDSFVVGGSIGSAATTITAASLTETTLLKLSGIDHTELGSLASANFDFV